MKRTRSVCISLLLMISIIALDELTGMQLGVWGRVAVFLPVYTAILIAGWRHG